MKKTSWINPKPKFREGQMVSHPVWNGWRVRPEVYKVWYLIYVTQQQEYRYICVNEDGRFSFFESQLSEVKT